MPRPVDSIRAELDTLPIVMEAMRDHHLLTFIRSVPLVCKHWHRVWQKTESCYGRLKALAVRFHTAHRPELGETQEATLERVRRELQAKQAQYDSLLRAMEAAPPAVL